MKKRMTVMVILLAPVLPAFVTSTITGSIAPKNLTHPETQQDADSLPDGHLWISAAMGPDQSPMVWIDARTLEQFDRDHMPDAVWCSEDDYETGLVNVLNAWNGEASLIVYCDSAACDASKMISDRLKQDLGVETVFVLHGGWDAWKSFRDIRP